MLGPKGGQGCCKLKNKKIRIAKNGTKFVSVVTKSNPLPIKIRFNNLRIEYIDHSVIEFLRSNRQIFEKGTNMDLYLVLDDLHRDNNGIVQPIRDFCVHEIWPIFAPNIRHLTVSGGHHLDDLRRHISPTIFTDCNQLGSIDAEDLLPDSIADDRPKAKAGQALSKWTPTKNGKPKQLSCLDYEHTSETKRMIKSFKEKFLDATSSFACFIIRIEFFEPREIDPFELTNERTNESLTLEKEENNDKYASERLLLKRCQIGATIQWPLSPPKAGKMNEKGPLRMNPGPSGQRKCWRWMLMLDFN